MIRQISKKLDAEKARNLEKERAFEDVREGLQCVLRNQIISMYNEYWHKQYIPIYACESLMRAYKVYRGLGGNDVATELVDKLLSLSTAPPEESGARAEIE